MSSAAITERQKARAAVAQEAQLILDEMAVAHELHHAAMQREAERHAQVMLQYDREVALLCTELEAVSVQCDAQHEAQSTSLERERAEFEREALVLRQSLHTAVSQPHSEGPDLLV